MKVLLPSIIGSFQNVSLPMEANICLTCFWPLRFWFKILVIFWYPFWLIRMFIDKNWSSSNLKFVANESTRAKSYSGWAPFFGRSNTVTFSTFVGDKLQMAGRIQLFRPAEILSINMLIVRNTTIRPKTTAGKCTEQYPVVLVLQNSEGFYNQKNRCSSARLENS